MMVPDDCKVVTDPAVDPLVTWSDEIWDSWTNSNVTVWAKVTIAVTNDLDPSQSEAVILVAENGVEIKCHKNLLAVLSKVLAAVVSSGFEQPGQRKIEMLEMTEAGVRAFLAYLCYADTTGAEENCEVAFELLDAAYRYDVEGLQRAMRNILVQKDTEWFTVDMVFKLFSFAKMTRVVWTLSGRPVTFVNGKFLNTKYSNLKLIF